MIRRLPAALVCWLVAAAAVAFVVVSPVGADIVSKTVTSKTWSLRYHYDDDAAGDAACSAVFFVGVGTAMSVGDYDEVASDMSIGGTSGGIVTIIADPAPGNPVKLFSGPYANQVNDVHANLASIVPACEGRKKKKDGDPIFVIGGHSASGQAAIDALDDAKGGGINFEPSGFFGLDPFEVNTKKMKIDVPALFWGFEYTTCLVSVDKAAEAGYEISPATSRVLYRIENKNKMITHCIFTDNGCTVVCPANRSGDWVRKYVGDSARAFARAIETGNYAKERFEPRDGEPVLLYANEDEVGANGGLPAASAPSGRKCERQCVRESRRRKGGCDDGCDRRRRRRSLLRQRAGKLGRVGTCKRRCKSRARSRRRKCARRCR